MMMPIDGENNARDQVYFETAASRFADSSSDLVCLLHASPTASNVTLCIGRFGEAARRPRMETEFGSCFLQVRDLESWVSDAVRLHR